MSPFLAKTLAMLSAVVVLFVSSTCTAAGCALGGEAPGIAAQSPCCQQHRDKSPAPAEDGRCPLCQGGYVVAKAVEKSLPHQGNPALLPAFLTPDFSLVTFAHTPAFFEQAPIEASSFASPPTLIALHCSLLI
jgi:hypothetical protein